MPNVINVRFRNKGKAYFFDPADTAPQVGDSVIVQTAKGLELGECVRASHFVEDTAVVPPLRQVVRIATEEDKAAAEANREKEKTALELCQKKIDEHKLDMKLVDAEYSFDGSKLLFFFTSDGRVDFRELVKDLAGFFHTRIELRQIGVRDSAKLVGGLGICGRPFCCSTFLDGFQPVSIKMAKTQSLSLNPTKISGTCGRLMCCLKYEQDAYEHLLKTVPKVDTVVDTPDGKGVVTEVNLLRRRVKVKLSDENIVDVRTYPARELGYSAGGSYKEPEPPEENEEAAESDTSEYGYRKSGAYDTPLSNISSLSEEKPVSVEQEETVDRTSGKNRNHNNRRRHGKKPQQAQAEKQSRENKSAQGLENEGEREQRNRNYHGNRGKRPYREQNYRKNEGEQHYAKSSGEPCAQKHEARPPMDEKAKARADAVAQAVAQAMPKGANRRRPHRGQRADSGKGE